MQPTFTPPIPVIGNHPAGCSCSTCAGARKRLLASPFVKRLISELTVLHEQFYKATEKQHCAPTSELEKRVLTLTDQLATSQNDIGVLTRALDQSRKISQEREKQLAEEKRLHKLSKMSDANARGILTQIHTEIGGDPDRPALDKIQGLVWQLENSRAEAESLRTANLSLQQENDCTVLERDGLHDKLQVAADRLTAIWFALPPAWRPADCDKLADNTGLFAKGWEDLVVRQRETEGQLTETQSTLKLANASIESLKQGSEQLGREVDALTDEVGRLTPFLPIWSRIAFAGLGIFLIAYWSHRAGFDAAMVLRGGAR